MENRNEKQTIFVIIQIVAIRFL